MSSEAEVRGALRDWVLKASSKKFRRDAAALAELGDQTDLLQRQVISSLKLMELIVFVSKLRGRPIDVTTIEMGSFSSIDTIYKNFFEGDRHAE